MKNPIVYILFACVSGASALAGDFFVATDGIDTNPGTLAAPFRTIDRGIQALSAGDKLNIRAGRYHESTIARNGWGGTSNAPIVIQAYNGEEVVLDGTKSISDISSGSWEVHDGQIYKIQLTQDIWQLFEDDVTQTSARWPNAFWNDGSIWDQRKWATFGNDSRISNGYGWIDTDVENPGIAASGIDATGAMIVMNVAGYDTYAETVYKHSPGSNRIETTWNTAGNDTHWYTGRGLIDAEVAGVTSDFGLGLVGARVALGIGGSDKTIMSTGGVSDGNWHHITATRDTTTGAMKLYIDGYLDVSGTGPTGSRTAPTAIRIGGILTGGASKFLDGQMDEVKLYSNVLTDAEVLTLADHGNVAGGLVAHYEFEDSVADSTVNGNDGTLTGASYAAGGVVGKALSLDGDGDFVDIPKSISGNFSISFWLKTEDHGPSKGYINHLPVTESGSIDSETGAKMVEVYNNFFLECSLSLLDAPTEWYYDRDTHWLYFQSQSGGDPGTSDIRGKVQTYFFDFKNCTDVTFKGLKFFGTTLSVTSSPRRIKVEACDFEYPSYSKRMLRSNRSPDITRIADSVQRNGAVFRTAESTVTNCTFTNCDGPGIHMAGRGNILDNCLFRNIDYSVIDPSSGGGEWQQTFRGNDDSLVVHCSPGIVINRVTVDTAGSSHNIPSGAHEDNQGDDRSVAKYCRVIRGGVLQAQDGANFHVWQYQSDYSTVHHSWASDSKKFGFRLDGNNQTYIGKHHNVHYCVAWNMVDENLWNGNSYEDSSAGGLRVGGDYQTVTHNVIHGARNGFNDVLIESRFDNGNDNSVFHNNLWASVDGGSDNAPFSGVDTNNIYTLNNQAKLDFDDYLRDPANLDFRPRRNSELIDEGVLVQGITADVVGNAPDIGAYEFGCTSYWIPGYKSPGASTPIPPNNAVKTRNDLDLMWLQGYQALSHSVYIDKGNGFEHLGDFPGDGANICHPCPTDEVLESGHNYQWRVDTIGPDGILIQGPVWQFTVDPAASPHFHPPVAIDQSLTTAEDVKLAVTLTAADEDGALAQLQFSVVAPPQHGTLSGSGPTRIYTPNSGFVGSDVFTYKANDGEDDSNEGTISITITPVNDPPVAVGGQYATLSTSTLNIVLTATDADGDSLVYAIVSPPSHGSLTGTAPNLTYTPTAGFNGLDSFTFKASDGLLDSEPATILISVDNDPAVNTVPVAYAISVTAIKQVGLPITLFGRDADNDALTYTIPAGMTTGHGTLSGTPPNIIYTSRQYTGLDSFNFVVNDGTTNSASVKVSINVVNSGGNPTNSPPTALPMSIPVPPAPPVAFTLRGSDPDGNGLTFSITGNPQHGSISGSPPSLIYTPNSGYRGEDALTFKANDGQADSAGATVSFAVQNGPNPPVADAGPDQEVMDWDDDGSVIVTLDGTGSSDSNGTIVSYLWKEAAAQIATSPNPSVSLAIGTHVISLTVADEGGNVTADTVTITVNEPSFGIFSANGDIGAVAASGSATEAGGLYTLLGSGSDIYGTADEFHYVYRDMSGDGTIVARVASLENVSSWSKAGVMIRETLADGSMYAAVFMTPGNGVAFQRRTSTGGATSLGKKTGLSAPYWVKLVRTGSTMNAYRSSDGSSWALQGTATISMAANVYVGLATCSHVDGTLCEAVFDNVTVTPDPGQ